MQSFLSPAYESRQIPQRGRKLQFSAYVEVEVQPNGTTEYRGYPEKFSNTAPSQAPPLLSSIQHGLDEYPSGDRFTLESSGRFLEDQLKKLVEKEPEAYQRDPITHIRFLQPRYWKISKQLPKNWGSWNFQTWWNQQTSKILGKTSYDVKDIENTVIGVDIGGRCSVRAGNWPYRIERFMPLTYYAEPTPGNDTDIESTFRPHTTPTKGEALPRLGTPEAEKRLNEIFTMWSQLFLNTLIKGAGSTKQAQRYYRRHKIDTISIAIPASFQAGILQSADLLSLKSGVDWAGLNNLEVKKRLLPILQKTFDKAGFKDTLAESVSVHLVSDAAAGIITEGTMPGGGKISASVKEQGKLFFISSGSGVGGSSSSIQAQAQTLLFEPMRIMLSSIGRNNIPYTDERPAEQRRQVGEQHIEGGIRKVQDYLSHYGLIKQAEWWELKFPEGTNPNDKPRMIIEWAFDDEHPQHEKAKNIIAQGMKVLLKETASVIGSQNGNAHVILAGGILRGIEDHNRLRQRRLAHAGQRDASSKASLPYELEWRMLKSASENAQLGPALSACTTESKKLNLLLNWALLQPSANNHKPAQEILEQELKHYLRQLIPALQTRNLNQIVGDICKALKEERIEKRGRSQDFVSRYFQDHIHEYLDDDIADSVTFQLATHSHNALGAAIYGIDEKCEEEQGTLGFRKIQINK